MPIYMPRWSTFQVKLTYNQDMLILQNRLSYILCRVHRPTIYHCYLLSRAIILISKESVLKLCLPVQLPRYHALQLCYPTPHICCPVLPLCYSTTHDDTIVRQGNNLALQLCHPSIQLRYPALQMC